MDGGTGPIGLIGAKGVSFAATSSSGALIFCPEGTIFASVSCGHNESDSGSKIWVKYVGGSPSASASRVAICTLSNDQNTDRLIDFGAYCVDE